MIFFRNEVLSRRVSVSAAQLLVTAVFSTVIARPLIIRSRPITALHLIVPMLLHSRTHSTMADVSWISRCFQTVNRPYFHENPTRIVNDVLLGLVNRQIRDSLVSCVRFYYVKPFMLLRMLPYAGPTEIGKSKNQPWPESVWGAKLTAKAPLLGFSSWYFHTVLFTELFDSTTHEK